MYFVESKKNFQKIGNNSISKSVKIYIRLLFFNQEFSKIRKKEREREIHRITFTC